jgi:hypothetical protein
VLQALCGSVPEVLQALLQQADPGVSSLLLGTELSSTGGIR